MNVIRSTDCSRVINVRAVDPQETYSSDRISSYIVYMYGTECHSTMIASFLSLIVTKRVRSSLESSNLARAIITAACLSEAKDTCDSFVHSHTKYCDNLRQRLYFYLLFILPCAWFWHVCRQIPSRCVPKDWQTYALYTINKKLANVGHQFPASCRKKMWTRMNQSDSGHWSKPSISATSNLIIDITISCKNFLMKIRCCAL